MRDSDWGRVIAVSSIAGLRGLRGASAYSASKHGLVGLVRSLAQDYAGGQITFNALCPGYVDTGIVSRNVESITQRTGMSPEDALQLMVRENRGERLIRPDEVANAALLLCLPGSEAVTACASRFRRERAAMMDRADFNAFCGGLKATNTWCNGQRRCLESRAEGLRDRRLETMAGPPTPSRRRHRLRGSRRPARHTPRPVSGVARNEVACKCTTIRACPTTNCASISLNPTGWWRAILPRGSAPIWESNWTADARAASRRLAGGFGRRPGRSGVAERAEQAAAHRILGRLVFGNAIAPTA